MSPLLIIILLVLLLGVPFGGAYYNDGAYRGYGFGLGGVLFIVLLVCLLTGGLRL